MIFPFSLITLLAEPIILIGPSTPSQRPSTAGSDIYSDGKYGRLHTTKSKTGVSASAALQHIQFSTDSYALSSALRSISVATISSKFLDRHWSKNQKP